MVLRANSWGRFGVPLGKITEVGGKVGQEELRNRRGPAWMLWGNGAHLSDDFILLSNYSITILLVTKPDQLFVIYKC